MIWLLVPLYNEADGVEDFLKLTFQKLEEFGEFRILIVDDGSCDKTFEIAEKGAGDKGNIIRFEQNQGPGKAFEAGFKYILQHGQSGDYILTIEGDNTADLNSLPSMLKWIKTHDLVLASVYLEKDGFSKTSAWRMLLSSIANKLSRKILEMPYLTLTSFYRLWSFDLLKKIDEAYSPMIESKGFICQVELLYKSHLLSAKIKEVPTRVYSERRQGKSKMKLLKTAISHFRFLLKRGKYQKGFTKNS